MTKNNFTGFLQLISRLLSKRGDIHYLPARNISFPKKILEVSAPYFFSGIKNLQEDIKLLNHGQVSRIDDIHCQNGHVSHYVSSLLLSRGTTLVSNHLEKRSPVFYDFYHEALKQEKIITHFNFYWSPPGSSGAGKHTDVHDVVVVQLAGRKRWNFDDKFIDMSVGDILFVRRGTMHDPISFDDCDSLHLTIGIVSAGKILPSFPEPPSLENDLHKRLALQFIKSMNVFFSKNNPIIHFDDNVKIYEEDGTVLFDDGGNKLGIKAPLFDAIFVREKRDRCLSFTRETNRQHISNLILSFYNAGLSFRLEE